MSENVNLAGGIMARAITESARYSASAGLPAKRQYRLAVPGHVWGDYPLASPATLPIAQRRNAFRSGRKVARKAYELFLGPTIPVDQARWALACGGLNAKATAIALACVAQVYQKSLGLKPRPNQLHTAAELLNQKLTELATGQGKSLAAALAAAVAAIAGSAVHVLTANHYLAQRDTQTHRAFFAELKLTVATALEDSTFTEKRDAYRCDVCYTTARTLAFDFLRDQSNVDAKPVLRGLCFAIVDEADSLLIDEASMPLVLSEACQDDTFEIDLAGCLRQAGQLIEGADFDVEPSTRQAKLRPNAIARYAVPPNADIGINENHRRANLQQALSALHVYKKGRDYLVNGQEVVLIDANTGRAAPSRVLPGYLHAFICTLEKVPPPASARNQTGLTYPRFFARYHHLSGLSGTLDEARGELKHCYGLKLARIPSHQKSQLRRYPDKAFKDQRTQFAAALHRAVTLSRSGRAVLIGTDTVRDARRLATGFKRAGIEAALLDAANEASEARRIGEAGKAGQITISTQIAGRGTDITTEPSTRTAGGLHVICLQHNRSGRIDRQMAGRAARQGEPGSWEHWISLHDSAIVPLPSTGLARHLHCLPRLLAWLGAVRPLVKGMQHLWQWQDRSQRYARLRADVLSAQSLQVSSMKHL